MLIKSDYTIAWVWHNKRANNYWQAEMKSTYFGYFSPNYDPTMTDFRGGSSVADGFIMVWPRLKKFQKSDLGSETTQIHFAVHQLMGFGQS